MVIVPPTPPVTLSTVRIPPSGTVGTRPRSSSGRFGSVTTAAPTIETNISSTITLRTFSKIEYRPLYTSTNPMIPHRTPQALTRVTGNTQAGASPVAALAAAPYTKPQITVYGPK